MIRKSHHSQMFSERLRALMDELGFPVRGSHRSSSTNLRFAGDNHARLSALCAATHIGHNEAINLCIAAICDLADAEPSAETLPKLVALTRAARQPAQSLTFRQ